MERSNEMKKIVYSLAIVISLMFLGCNHKIERCEQYYDYYELPELSKDSYNRVNSATLNYVYNYRFNTEKYINLYPNPADSIVGDTLKICGFIINYDCGNPISYSTDSTYWSCYMSDDSLFAMNTGSCRGGGLFYGPKENLPLNIDITKKCYCTVIADYNYPNIQFDDIDCYCVYLSSPDACITLYPVFHVLEIYN